MFLFKLVTFFVFILSLLPNHKSILQRVEEVVEPVNGASGLFVLFLARPFLCHLSLSSSLVMLGQLYVLISRWRHADKVPNYCSEGHEIESRRGERQFSVVSAGLFLAQQSATVSLIWTKLEWLFHYYLFWFCLSFCFFGFFFFPPFLHYARLNQKMCLYIFIYALWIPTKKSRNIYLSGFSGSL